MQDRIQLKREEVVGDGVALSDINPVTNTKSVDDDSTGASLDVTIDRIWAAINNRLTRIVNSVNGRDGVVVLSAEDVGLGNVSNISFSDIKDWVIEEIMQQFGFKRLHIFEDYAEFTTTMNTWVADKARANTSFYIKEGNILDANQSALPIIGYLEWDEGSGVNVPHTKEINAVQFSDNSIIYNESVNGKNFNGGGIAVNIWRGEDALKLYVNDGQTIDTMPKNQSGLYIDKSKIAPKIYYFDCVYGTGVADPNAFIYADDQSVSPPALSDVSIKINGEDLSNASDQHGYFYTPRTFKINDIIITNFSDKDCRDAVTGVVPAELDSLLLNREACIGQVTSIGGTPSRPLYEINFTTLKPNVGMGLKNFSIHTGSGDVDGTILGIDLMIGTIIPGADNDNISGLNVFTSPNRSNPRISESKVHHTVTPIGDMASDANTSPSYNSLFISPDFSLNVIPYNTFGATSGTAAEFNPIKNWPAKVPELSTVTSQSFLGVNLLKKITIDEDGGAFNMSGLKILNNTDVVSNATLGKSDNDTEDILYTSIDPSRPGEMRGLSGGLAVNVGKFLEIGGHVGDDAGAVYDKTHYYDGGKVNVRTDERAFEDNGDNVLSLKLSRYDAYGRSDLNTTLGGGLTFTNGTDPIGQPFKITPGLTINRGLGLRMSKYDRFGVIPDEYIYTPVIESEYTAGTYYTQSDDTWTTVTVTGSGTVEDPYVPAWEAGVYFTRSANPDAFDKAHLAVSVFDPKFNGDFDDGTLQEQKKCYGGLRYVVSDSMGTNQISGIGLRVNEQNADYGHELRLGSRAVGIDENNIVGLQLYRESDNVYKDINPLNIKSWNEYALYPYIDMPWMSTVVVANTYENLVDGEFAEESHLYGYKVWWAGGDDVVIINGADIKWAHAGWYYKRNVSTDGLSSWEPSVFVTVDSNGNYTPTFAEAQSLYGENIWGRIDVTPDYSHRSDIIYYVKEDSAAGTLENHSRRYVWNTTDQEYQPMFEYYNVDLDDGHGGGHGAPPATGEHSKVYVTYVVDNEEHKIYGNMYQWNDGNIIELPMSYDETTHTYDRNNPNVNAGTATSILTFYTMKQTGNIMGAYYFNNEFYLDENHDPSSKVDPIILSGDVMVEDLTYPAPRMLYTYNSNTRVYEPVDFGYGTNYVREDFLPLDLDKDGHINATDASIALSYYAARQTGDPIWDNDEFRTRFPNPTNRDYLLYYLEKAIGVDTSGATGYKSMHATDPNGSFIPGLDIDINEYQGLTTRLEGDIKKSVSVKLFDKSAGHEVNGKAAEINQAFAKRGGLRFNKEGYLGIRVNELNDYDATTPEGRTGTDVQSAFVDSVKLDSIGTRGLMIYESNVAGVQLTPEGNTTNGELCFDEYGSLHISPDYHGGGGGGGELLTITDGTNTVEYNGSVAQTITLGPGLMLEPDPPPNP